MSLTHADFFQKIAIKVFRVHLRAGFEEGIILSSLSGCGKDSVPHVTAELGTLVILKVDG